MLPRLLISRLNLFGRLVSGPVNPRAKITKSQSHVLVEPGISMNSFLSESNLTFTVSRPIRLLSESLTNPLVNILHSLSAPSSWEDDVLSVKGQ